MARTDRRRFAARIDQIVDALWDKSTACCKHKRKFGGVVMYSNGRTRLLCDDCEAARAKRKERR